MLKSTVHTIDKSNLISNGSTVYYGKHHENAKTVFR